MKNFIILSILIWVAACAPVPKEIISEEVKVVAVPLVKKDTFSYEKDYLRRFAQLAVSERRKYGIPASLILAVACRQSLAGHHLAVQHANNHFQLPSSFDWAGSTETVNGQKLRHYENAWVSFRDFSIFATSGKFAELRQFSASDYESWANGLQRLGYADASFSADVTALIKRFGLAQLDVVK